MDPTEDKRRRGAAFLKRLGDKDLLFTGISGSVSYEAANEDDIDIFLISHTHRLWRTLLRAFLLRRLHGDRDICLSLTMDGQYATKLFSREGEALLASDAVHVIPIHGANFYAHLLDVSPFVKANFPERKAASSGPCPPDRRGRSVMETTAFVLLGTYLAVVSMYSNWRISRRFGKERAFCVKLSPHYFYLDTEKYHRLRERVKSARTRNPGEST